jgi:hypothetical protein
MNCNYWIYEDIFCFKPNFNRIITNYIEIIKDYKILIFSKYTNLEICIRTNNFFDCIYLDYYSLSKFNQPLSNSLDNLIILEQLTFSSAFNQPLANSLNNLIMLEQLTFGHDFNQPLSNSLDNLIMLEKLTFGYDFNQPLSNSLDNLI